MNVQGFLENFRYVAEAPNGVKRLREVVLHLAITGALVEQRPGDGRAEETLAQAEQARQAYQALHGLRQRQLHGSIREDEKPFVLPAAWKWSRLECIACYIQRGKGPDYAQQGKVRAVSQKCIQWQGFDLAPARRISDSSLERYSDERFLVAGDVLWNSTGTGTAGRVAVFPGADGPVVADSHVTVVRVTNFVPQYLWYYLSSPSIQQRTLPGNDASLVSGTTNQVELSMSRVAELPVPCPPVAEQHRIVAKVDALMALCDELETRQKELERLNARLSPVSNARILEDLSPENLEAIFFEGADLITSDIRQSVVTLAVQGRLVPQDLREDPAPMPLQSIRQREKQISRLAAVREDEKAFSIPETWRWERLGNIALGSDSGWSPKCENVPRSGTAWGVLKVSAVSWGSFLPDENKALPSHLEGRPQYEVKDGDFLISRANTSELVARSVVVRNPPPQLMMSDKIVRFNIAPEMDSDFVNLAHSSMWARQYYTRSATGTSSSMKNVSRATIANLPLAIPPLSEQRRIVARVDELMALIDKLQDQKCHKMRIAEAFARAAVSAITGTAGQDTKPMKAPNSKLVTRLQFDRTLNLKPGAAEPLAALLSSHDGGLSAKALWQRSGLAIDDFYQQLKTEMAAGWISEPEPAVVREVESD